MRDDEHPGRRDASVGGTPPPASPDGGAAKGGGNGSLLAFLPIGITFMVIGMTQGLDETGGLTFLVMGLAFIAMALSTGPARPRGTRRDLAGHDSSAPDRPR